MKNLVGSSGGLAGEPLFRCLLRVCTRVSPARLVDELLQPRFDLVVRKEGHVAWVSDCQAVPVPQQGRPRLHTRTRTKRECDSCSNEQA